MSLIQEMMADLRMGRGDLLRIISTAPARYKEYTIPKRRGGLRTIAQPSRELKVLQRYVLETKLQGLRIHGAATGYIRGQNILHNARAHQHNRVILKLDFEDFFPSIKVTDWDRYLRIIKPTSIERADLELYRRILFWGQKSSVPRCLSIGAPTSPALSNILLFDFDTKLAIAASRFNVIYTRYADDITVSANNLSNIFNFEGAAVRIVAATKSPSLTFNGAKRGLYFRGQKRMVTGLIITPINEVSIGRERKRLISVMLHKVTLGQTDIDHINYLKGMLGFCIANEPAFVSRMRAKYGSDTVDRVLKHPIVRGSRS
jgi:hypothetical protein